MFLGSIIYKQQYIIDHNRFPIPAELKKSSSNAQLYLFFSFSIQDCNSCILEIVEFLKTLPSQFQIAGLVPGEELKDEPGLRRATGVSFPLYSSQKFQKYLPGYTPTLYGISSTGKIIFVLPGVAGQIPYLRNILVSLYGELYSLSRRENSFVEVDK